jgi:uncharacterized protein (TIGR04255 family)
VPFPKHRRVVYKRNPLSEVICQLRFPTILRIGTNDIAIFQDSIRREYPLYESKEAAIEFLNVPQEFSAIFDKMSFPSPSINTHRFLSQNKKRFIALSRDFLAYSDTDYQRWEDFKDKVGNAEQALQDNFKPAFYSRIGLRYKDVINPQVLGFTNLKWSDLLQPHIIGELGDVNISSDISEIMTQTAIKIDDIPGSQVTLRHGLLKESTTKSMSYLIDADFSIAQTEETHGTVDVLEAFHGLAGRLFRWAITDYFHKALEPETVE